MSELNFKKFPKIARLESNVIITEKIDGTNGQIYKTVDGQILIGSRSQWLTIEKDNFGFAKWVKQYEKEWLKFLQPDQRIYGEWYGHGIQRGYGLKEKRFMIFNPVGDLPNILNVERSTILYEGVLDYLGALLSWKSWLINFGSKHVEGYNRPEGLIVYFKDNATLFKIIIDK